MVNGNNPSLSLLLCIACILSDTRCARWVFVASIITQIIMLTELAQLPFLPALKALSAYTTLCPTCGSDHTHLKPYAPWALLKLSQALTPLSLKSYKTPILSGTTRPSVKTSWALNAQNFLCRYLAQQSQWAEYRILVDSYCMSDILVAPEDIKVIRTVAFIWEHLSIEVSFRTRNVSPLLLFQMIYKSTGLTKAALIPSDGLRRKKEKPQISQKEYSPSWTKW